MMVPDDELLIQEILGINTIPDDILSEYALRIRMYHKQGAGGGLGPLALIDMLRFVGYSCESAKMIKPVERVNWREQKIGSVVEVRVDGLWLNTPATFEGEVGGGILAVERFGKIDEFNSFDVRLPASELPSDVDPEAFKKENATREKDQPDARDSLILTDEQERSIVDSIFDNSEMTKRDWSKTKKGTRIWYRDQNNDVHQGDFGRFVKGDKCEIQLDGENSRRKNISVENIVLADS